MRGNAGGAGRWVGSEHARGLTPDVLAIRKAQHPHRGQRPRVANTSDMARQLSFRYGGFACSSLNAGVSHHRRASLKMSHVFDCIFG